MNTKKKRFALKKRLIKHFLTLTLAGTLLLPGLILIQPMAIEANPIVDMASGVVGKIRYNTTVAELIVSLLSGSGANVTNTNWLNKINQSYGIESTLATATNTDGTLGAMYEAGLFSIDNNGHYIDNGLAQAIRNQPAYSDGVSQVFETTSTDMQLGAWQTADAATNLGEAASSGIHTGSIGQFFGSVSLGVNLGIVANKFANWVGYNMANNAMIDSISRTGLDEIEHRNGYQSSWISYVTTSNLNRAYGVQTDTNLIPILLKAGNYVRIGVYNPNTNLLTYYWSNNTSGPDIPNAFDDVQRNALNNYATAISSFNTKSQKYGGFNVFEFATQQELYDYWNNLRDGNLTLSKNNYPTRDFSPDVIGPAGNQRPSNYNDVSNISSWPNLKPSPTIEDTDVGIKPISWNDYMDQTTIFNNNTSNNIINQGDIYNQFIDQYITVPDISTPVETPDYGPVVPEQPTPNEKEELTSESIQETTDYMTTPGLKDKFPFSIPWDVAALFNVFSTDSRQAPVISFPIVSEMFGIDETVTIDFSVYDDVAAILRLLELIGFGIGLAILTRYIIGG